MVTKEMDMKFDFHNVYGILFAVIVIVAVVEVMLA